MNMRIDYSEPKQSYVGTQAKKKLRKEPIGMVSTIVIITGLITFIFGFGTGWLLSQRSAKKAFQAANEQTSLENSPKEPAQAKAIPQQPQTAAAIQQQPQTATTTLQLPQAASADLQTQAPATQKAPEPSLSFYKTLPIGQKSNVMGSGINSKEEKPKQALQAIIPSNISRPQQSAADAAKTTGDRQQSLLEINDRSGFSIQVSSYSLKSEAETVKNKLAGKGYSAYIVESNLGDKGVWFRVRVGRKMEHDAAKELAGKLGKGVMVVPDRE
jgi:cell division protein FtsN